GARTIVLRPDVDAVLSGRGHYVAAVVVASRKVAWNSLFCQRLNGGLLEATIAGGKDQHGPAVLEPVIPHRRHQSDQYSHISEVESNIGAAGLPPDGASRARHAAPSGRPSAHCFGRPTPRTAV